MAETTVTLTMSAEEWRYFFTRFALGSKADELGDADLRENASDFHAAIMELLKAQHAFASLAPFGPEKRRAAFIVRVIGEARAQLGHNASGVEVDGLSVFGGRDFDATGVKS